MTDRTQEGMLAAVRADPKDDTPRLAYADWLDEQDQVWVPCATCMTNFGTKSSGGLGWLLAGGNGEAYFHVPCLKCGGKETNGGILADDNSNKGTGFVRDTSNQDRAEFIRVQCELAKWPALADATPTGRKSKDGSEIREVCQRGHDLRKRESELLARHKAAWSRWSCPGCGGTGSREMHEHPPGSRSFSGACHACGGTGDLFHGFEVSFRRGFPHRLMAKKLEEWVEPHYIDNSRRDQFNQFRWCPSPRLLACRKNTTAQEYLWGSLVPVMLSDGEHCVLIDEDYPYYQRVRARERPAIYLRGLGPFLRESNPPSAHWEATYGRWEYASREDALSAMGRAVALLADHHPDHHPEEA